MIKKLNKNYKGLTLIEAVINIYVYTILIMVCMAVSISYIKIRIQLRQSQLAVEEISLEMNQMTKYFRMQECSDAPGAWAFPANSRCIVYGGSGAVTWNFVNTKDATTPFVFVTWGSTSVLNDAGGIPILENVGGTFLATNDNGSVGVALKIPLITIRMWKYNKDGTKMPGTDVQTSVSMRSGYEANTN